VGDYVRDRTAPKTTRSTHTRRFAIHIVAFPLCTRLKGTYRVDIGAGWRYAGGHNDLYIRVCRAATTLVWRLNIFPLDLCVVQPWFTLRYFVVAVHEFLSPPGFLADGLRNGPTSCVKVLVTSDQGISEFRNTAMSGCLGCLRSYVFSQTGTRGARRSRSECSCTV
jgi:hypothetical protein